MKLAWATDIHLNFVEPREAEAFCRRIAASGAEALLVGGDVAEADSLDRWLLFLEGRLAMPIYYVLGNHDFYRGRIDAVRALAKRLSATTERLRWLGGAGVVKLTATSGLIGHDGWGDARLGNFWGTPVDLSDFHLIDDLAGLDRPALGVKLAALGDEAAEHFERVLPEALDRFDHVVVLTHVPPFRESCWHEGRISDDDWLPFFSCQAVGEVLRREMESRPDRSMTVLCGHTHSGGRAQILPNLYVRTGGAQYGRPAIQDPLVKAP